MKNFPLSIHKTQTHKSQSKIPPFNILVEIKIGLHKKAASLMNSNQGSNHSSAIENQNVEGLVKMNANKPIKALDSQKQSLLLSQQTSFNEYMSNNNAELRSFGPQVDNFFKGEKQSGIQVNYPAVLSSDQPFIHTSDTFKKPHDKQQFSLGNTLINQSQTSSKQALKSFDQRAAMGLQSTQSQRASLLGTVINDAQQPISKNQAYRSHTNSFKNSQVAMKHPQQKYVKGPFPGPWDESQQKKTLQAYHQRTFSDNINNQYMNGAFGHSAGQTTYRNFQDLIKSANDRDQMMDPAHPLASAIGINSEELIHQSLGSQHPAHMLGFNAAGTQINYNAKTTLGSSRQSIQSQHAEERDAIVQHYKKQNSHKTEKYSDLKSIYNGMLRDQMHKTKQALKLTQQQFGAQSRKNVSYKLNANTQSYRASNYAPLTQSVVSGQTLSSKLGRMGDNKSTPKLMPAKKAKVAKQKSQNTSSQGNRNSNNTTQITNGPHSHEKASKKHPQQNFLLNQFGGMVQNNANMHINISSGSGNMQLKQPQMKNNINDLQLQQANVHKRSISDGNNTFLSLNKKIQNFSSVIPSEGIMGITQAAQISHMAGGSAPISELSNIDTHPKPSSQQKLHNGPYSQHQTQGKQSEMQLNTDRIGNISQLNSNTQSSVNSYRVVSGKHLRHNSQQMQFDADKMMSQGSPVTQIPLTTKKQNNAHIFMNKNENTTHAQYIINPQSIINPANIIPSGQQKMKQVQSNKNSELVMVIEDQGSDTRYSLKNGAKSSDNKSSQKHQPSLLRDIGSNEHPLSLQGQLKVVEERIETQDSAMSDPNLSPRTKFNSKISKKVKFAFQKTNNPPVTTSEFYKIGKVMGKGAFGKVNLAVHRLSEKFVALKSINKQFLSEEASKRKVMQEFNILRRTRHKNIVRLYESFETAQHIVFVMEVCGAGDLLTYVRRRRKLKEDVAKHVFKQIVEGLKYCHSKNILHRDIKLDNILLTSEGDVKICDFGVSKLVRTNEIMTEQCGTPAYIAPEVFENKGYEGYASDIWSAGVVLYAMLYGTVPFKASNMTELQKQITKCQTTFKEEISAEAISLLKEILEREPGKRMSVNEILKHEWMQDIPEFGKIILQQQIIVSVFSDQEKEKINQEFAYYNFKGGNDGNSAGEVVHTDPFTEQMLNSTQNSLIKNVSSKSVILAPFNSTRSHIDNDHHLRKSIQDLLIDKKNMKFAAKVKEINRQYEMNNNAELDNGVYHQEDEEEDQKPKKGENSLETSFDNNEMKNLSNDKVELLMKENKDHAHGEEDRKLQSEIEEAQQRKKNSEWQKLEQMVIEKQKCEDEEEERLNFNEKSTAIGTAQTLIINERYLNEVEKTGYPRTFLVQSLNNDELNYATAFYYLLATQKEF